MIWVFAILSLNGVQCKSLLERLGRDAAEITDTSSTSTSTLLPLMVDPQSNITETFVGVSNDETTTSTTSFWPTYPWASWSSVEDWNGVTFPTPEPNASFLWKSTKDMAVQTLILFLEGMKAFLQNVIMDRQLTTISSITTTTTCKEQKSHFLLRKLNPA